MHLGDPDLEQRPLAGVSDARLDLGARLLERLLDRSRVDSPVGHQLLECDPGHLSPHRVERSDGDRLGSVVDDEVDPGHRLEGTDVPTLAADDPALHVVGREFDDGDRRLGHHLGCEPLDGCGQDATGTPVGFLARPDLGIAHQHHGVALGVGLHLLEKLTLGRDDIEIGDPFKRGTGLLALGFNLYSKLGHFLLAVDEELLALRQVARPLLQGPLPGGEPLLARLNLDSAHLEGCVFALAVALGSRPSLLVGFRQHPLSLDACRSQHLLGGGRGSFSIALCPVPTDDRADHIPRHPQDDCGDAANDPFHLGCPSRSPGNATCRTSRFGTSALPRSQARSAPRREPPSVNRDLVVLVLSHSPGQCGCASCLSW